MRCARIGRLIRAAAYRFAFAVGRNHPLRDIAPEIEDELFVLLALPRETSDRLEQRRIPCKLGQFFLQARNIIRIQRVSGPIIERVLTVFFLIQRRDFTLVRNAPPPLGRPRKPYGVRLRLLEAHPVHRIVLRASIDFVILIELCELRPGYLESPDFQIAAQHDLGHQHVLALRAERRTVVAAGLHHLVRAEHRFERRTFFYGFVFRFCGLEEIFVEPRHFFRDLAHLVRQLARAVRLAGEHHEFHGHLAVVLEHPEIRPALRRRNIGVRGAMENQHRGLHFIHFEKRRFVDVQLRILHRRFAEIICVKRFAEDHVAPVADPFNIAGANAGDFVAIRIGRNQARRKNRSVRPPHSRDLVRISHSFADQIIHAGIDVRRFQVVVFPAANRLRPFQSVVIAAVIVWPQHERAALRQQLDRIRPALVPQILVRALGAAVNRGD